MGFWRTSVRVVEGVTSLGGTERLRYYQEQYHDLWQQYLNLQSAIGARARHCFRKQSG